MYLSICHVLCNLQSPCDNIIMVNTKSTVQYNLPNCNGFMTAIYFSSVLCLEAAELELASISSLLVWFVPRKKNLNKISTNRKN